MRKSIASFRRTPRDPVVQGFIFTAGKPPTKVGAVWPLWAALESWMSPFVVAMPDSHPAAKQESVRIKTLAGLWPSEGKVRSFAKLRAARVRKKKASELQVLFLSVREKIGPAQPMQRIENSDKTNLSKEILAKPPRDQTTGDGIRIEPRSHLTLWTS